MNLEQRPEIWILASSIQDILLKELSSLAFWRGFLLILLVLLRRSVLRFGLRALCPPYFPNILWTCYLSLI